jgi:hypothetical protein
MIQEFGSAKRNIPARKPLRGTVEKQKTEIRTKLKTLTKRCLEGAKASTERGKIGAWFAGEIKKTIRAGGNPSIANAQSTILKKGEDAPLRDTGLLMESYTWQEL